LPDSARQRDIRIQQSVIRTSIQAAQTVASITHIQEKASHAMKSTEVWIGRFDVKPRLGNDALGAAKGAIVNVVALATSDDGFLQMVKSAMNEYEFDTLHYDDVTPLVEWRRNNTLDEGLEDLVNSLTSEFPIQFDEFQSYLHDDG